MAENENELKTSFAPVAGRRARILILGSLPGDRSLQAGQYYAHPRNRFWPLIASLIEQELPPGYDERVAMLTANGIALWDVIYQAERAGSLDTNILREIPNGLDDFVDAHPELETIAFNGAKSLALFDKYFARRTAIRYLALPSTSPANASFTIERLREKWKALFTVSS